MPRVLRESLENHENELIHSPWLCRNSESRVSPISQILHLYGFNRGLLLLREGKTNRFQLPIEALWHQVLACLPLPQSCHNFRLEALLSALGAMRENKSNQKLFTMKLQLIERQMFSHLISMV